MSGSFEKLPFSSLFFSNVLWHDLLWFIFLLIWRICWAYWVLEFITFFRFGKFLTFLTSNKLSSPSNNLSATSLELQLHKLSCFIVSQRSLRFHLSIPLPPVYFILNTSIAIQVHLSLYCLKSDLINTLTLSLFKLSWLFYVLCN